MAIQTHKPSIAAQKALSKRVTALRKERELSQSALAKHSMLPISTLRSIEYPKPKQTVNPTLASLEALAKGLKIFIKELF